MCKIKKATQANLAGLAQQVAHVAAQLHNVSGVRVGLPRRYRGEPKIKVPVKWPKGTLLVVTCDEHGQREISLLAESKRRAILRHLLTPLVRQGVTCELRSDS